MLIFRDHGMFVASIAKDGRVAMRRIHIDTDFGTAVDVNIGLENGDKVIDNPPDSLRAGDLVKAVSKIDTV